MLRNIFRISFRQLIHHPFTTIVNLIGLTFGICSCITVYIIVHHEFSYDRFHPDSKRLYRVLSIVTESTSDQLVFASAPSSLATEGRFAFHGIQNIATLVPTQASISIPEGPINKPSNIFESRVPGTHFFSVAFAEPEYFRLFPYKWLAGDPTTALQSPFQVVLTESKARLYFGGGNPVNWIGKKIIYNDSLLVTISGIIEDWKQNTDLAFTDFISFQTLSSQLSGIQTDPGKWNRQSLSAWTFVKLEKGENPAITEKNMDNLAMRFAASDFKISFSLEPLLSIHFNRNIIENPLRTADQSTLYLLMVIAVILLSLAIVNFINLSTARSFRRAREIGVRKVLGGDRKSIILQFFMETFLITTSAAVIGFLLVNPVLYYFQSFIPEGITYKVLDGDRILFLGLIILTTALLAGWHPSKNLSSFSPARNLKGPDTEAPGKGRLSFSKSLIVFQFCLSLVFIMASLIISNQLKYASEKFLGFIPDHVIILSAPKGENPNKFSLFSEESRSIPGIDKVAMQWLPPMSDNPRGMKLKFRQSDPRDFWVTQVAGNEDYIPLYQIRMLAGRNLSKTDTVNELVINESLSRMMGDLHPAESIGKFLFWNDKPYPVVGVVSDFHTSSLHDPLTPLCIINRPDRESSMAVKLQENNGEIERTKATIKKLADTWKQFYPNIPFQYTLFKEDLESLYKKDKQASKLVQVSMIAMILISCIGLFGLIIFMADRKAKEISIRKVVGAQTIHILWLLGKTFLQLVIVALLISVPLTWIIMSHWLEDFAFHVQISIWDFLLAGLIIFAIVLLTIGYQARQASISSPIKNLRKD